MTLLSNTSSERVIKGAPNTRYIAIDPLAAGAASIRAKYGFGLPDAFQVAAAVHVGADALLTNDAQLRQVTELRILMIEDLEP